MLNLEIICNSEILNYSFLFYKNLSLKEFKFIFLYIDRVLCY